MNVLMLLDEIAHGKTESGKVDALLSLRLHNPHTDEWIHFSELEDQYLTEAYCWNASLSEYSLSPGPAYPVQRPMQPPPISSGYGGVDLSKKYPPTLWKRAKRWLRKYGWIPALLAGAGITWGVTRLTRKDAPPPPKEVKKRAPKIGNLFKSKTINQAKKELKDMSPEDRNIFLAFIKEVIKSAAEEPTSGDSRIILT